ncbi:MAG: response regulator [Caldimonas sp.]
MSEAIQFRPIQRGKHVILVIDDDPIGRYTTIRWLQKAGFQTLEATTGQEGLELATGEVSAIVLDVHLPDINGFDLCQTIRSRGDADYLPVLHLSAAFVTDEDKVRGLDSGADAYLTRPVDPAVLVATVQALVRTRVAEDSLRRSEAQFRAVYERVPAGICLLDPDGRIVDANPAMLDYLMRSAEQISGRSLHEFVPAESQETAKLLFTLDSSSEKQFPVDRPDGSSLQVQWTMLANVRPGLNMLMATDMTAPVLLEEQRVQALQRERAARAEAERIGRAKDELVAVLSHELRSPLTTIMGWMHIFRRGPIDETKQRHGLEIIERSVALQARLVSDLLDMSSINLGKMRLALAETDVPHLLHAVLDAAETALAEKGLRAAISIEGTCPLIRADPARVQQITSNLLSNAIKFSVSGGDIAIVAKPRQAGVLVSVSDHGAGISEDFIPRLFDRFSQADVGSNRRHGGLGLGLSIVRHLVESHDGTVSVESAGLGSGATFSFWLPTSGPAGEAARDPASEESDSGSTNAVLDGISLLVVDDDPDVAATIALILRDRGATVRVAGNYEDALAAIQSVRPDVLLSDVGMPGKDGYALIHEIRRTESGKRLPAVAVTSYTRDQDKAHALESGFDAHCSKPVRAAELVRTVQRLLVPLRRLPFDRVRT